MRTEHGAESRNTVNVVVKIYLSIRVTIALYERVERRIAHTYTCK